MDDIDYLPEAQSKGKIFLWARPNSLHMPMCVCLFYIAALKNNILIFKMEY